MIFHNPVRVEWGSPDFRELPEAVAGRRAALVTTAGMESRGVVARLRSALGSSAITSMAMAKPNPTIASIQENADAILATGRPEVIIALGGGSALDTAKGVAAIASTGSSRAWLGDHLRAAASFPHGFSPPPIIAIPTTSGTGSEVTMWGTVWDETSGAKYSVSHPRLYAERAVLVPEMTTSAPAELTLFTALDAVSHCMEAVWNRRAGAVSDAFAAAGLARLLGGITDVIVAPEDLAVRRRLQEGALLGGLAISCTATALAHSISYPLTSTFGMPHGLACSFTLPEMLEFNYPAAPDRMNPIVNALELSKEESPADALRRLFDHWGVRSHARRYMSAESAATIKDRLLTPGRADNNVRPATHDDALNIVERALA